MRRGLTCLRVPRTDPLRGSLWPAISGHCLHSLSHPLRQPSPRTPKDRLVHYVRLARVCSIRFLNCIYFVLVRLAAFHTANHSCHASPSLLHARRPLCLGTLLARLRSQLRPDPMQRLCILCIVGEILALAALFDLYRLHGTSLSHHKIVVALAHEGNVQVPDSR